MNQLTTRLLLAGTIIVLGSCSDDDGIDIRAKDPGAQAGSGGDAAAGAGGGAGTGGTGTGGSGGNGGSAGEPPDAGTGDTCTPVFLDAGVGEVTDAGADAGDAGDAGRVAANGAVTFAADIHPIFRAKCVPCHEDQMSGGHNVAAANVDEAYGFVDRIKDRVVDEVASGDMPVGCTGGPGDPGCISVAELQLIERWAAQCFPR